MTIREKLALQAALEKRNDERIRNYLDKLAGAIIGGLDAEELNTTGDEH